MKNKQKEELLAQAVAEYNHALDYRQRRHAAWQKVDDLYFGKKKQSLVTRANVHIPKMQGTIETFLSKVDDAPFLQFDPMEEGDKKAANFNNTLLNYDRSEGDWDLIDLSGKKEAALYGRTIFKKYSTNEDGFTDYMDSVDVYDFLIDPMAGGLKPFEKARYCGQDNIIKTISELQDNIYDKNAVNRLKTYIKNDRGADSQNDPKAARRASLGLSDAVLVSGESCKLTEWYTLFGGVWYYLFMDMRSGISVRTEKLSEIFPFPVKYILPFGSWAPFPRASEFWTPGVGELIAEPNVIQDIIVSQMLDNNTFRNYGMKAYDSNKVINPAQLTPRPMGKIAVDGNPKDVVMDIQFPTLDNASQLYTLIDNIFDRETGITANAKGAPNSKRMSATEFAGLLDNVADRFLTANKTYKHTLKRLMMLYYFGLQQNMTSARAVRILGADGYEYRKVKAEDLKMSKFDTLISSGLEDEQNKNIQRDRFRDFVTAYKDDPTVNQTFLKEKDALNMGFSQDEVRRFLSPSDEGNWEILSEAASENEMLLSKPVPPNKGATAEHIQRHLDFIKRMDDLSTDQVKRFMTHIQGEQMVFVENEQRLLNRELTQQGKAPNEVIRPQNGPATFPEQVRIEAIRNAPQP